MLHAACVRICVNSRGSLTATKEVAAYRRVFDMVRTYQVLQGLFPGAIVDAVCATNDLCSGKHSQQCHVKKLRGGQ